MTIKQFDKPTLRHIRKKLQVHLDQLQKELGIELELGNITFEANSFTGKLKGTIEGHDQQAEDYKQYARFFDLKLEWLGQPVRWTGGKVFTIKGLNTKARKNKVVIQANGKNYSTTPRSLIRAMDLNQTNQ